MKGLLVISCLLIVFLSGQSSALNCNGCTFHRNELVDTLNCNVSYTCSPGVTSCETIVTKEDGEYLIIFGCGVGYCKDANRVNEGLDKCSTSDKCYQCCNQDSCNTVADFSSFAKKTINVQVEPEGGDSLDKQSKVAADSVNADASKNVVAQDSTTTTAAASTSAGSSTATTAKVVVVESKDSQGDDQIKDLNAKQMEASVENAAEGQTTASATASASTSAGSTASTVTPIPVEIDDDESDSDSIENTTEKPGETTKDKSAEEVNKDAEKFEDELESDEDGKRKSAEDKDKEIILDDDLDDILMNDDAGTNNGLDGKLKVDQAGSSSSSTAGVETTTDSTSAAASATTTESPSSATSQFGYFKLILITISLIIASLN